MAKKFDAQQVTNKFFTQDTQIENDILTPPTLEKPKRGRPKKDTPLRGYRYNLTLDGELKAFLHQMAWEKHTSITQYLNDLIRKEKDKFIEAGGEIDPYFEEEE